MTVSPSVPGLSPGIWEYTLDLGSLGVTAGRIEGALGAPPEGVNETLSGAICLAVDKASRLIEIRAGYRILPEPSLMVHGDGFRLAGVAFHTGRDIAEALQGATGMALFAATLGERFDAWVRQCQAHEEPFLVHAAEAVGVVAAEEAGRWLEARIAQTSAHAGLSLTAPHCPGLGGWDVSAQRKLFSLLPPRFCGITLNDGALMRPTKSISGVVGIGPGLVRRGGGGCLRLWSPGPAPEVPEPGPGVE